MPDELALILASSEGMIECMACWDGCVRLRWGPNLKCSRRISLKGLRKTMNNPILIAVARLKFEPITFTVYARSFNTYDHSVRSWLLGSLSYVTGLSRLSCCTCKRNLCRTLDSVVG
jgi:hypothetical protein